MANLTASRNTEQFSSVKYSPELAYGAAASTIYYAGLMQTLDSSARPHNPGTVTEPVVGMVRETRENIVPNNRADVLAGANDYMPVEFQTGIMSFDAHGTHPPTAADVQKFAPVYASDNHTLSRLASDGSPAGFVVAVEGTKIIAAIGPWAINLAAELAGFTPLTENAGAIGGTNDGNLPDLTATSHTIADDSGGAASTSAIAVLVDAGGTAAGAPTTASVANALATIAAQVVLIKADLAAAVAAVREVAAKVNSL